MIYGDQWYCRCGWSNLFVRTKCRRCGEPKAAQATTVPFFELLPEIERACADRSAITE